MILVHFCSRCKNVIMNAWQNTKTTDIYICLFMYVSIPTAKPFPSFRVQHSNAPHLSPVLPPAHWVIWRCVNWDECDHLLNKEIVLYTFSSQKGFGEIEKSLKQEKKIFKQIFSIVGNATVYIEALSGKQPQLCHPNVRQAN